jgi:hypothetical protein
MKSLFVFISLLLLFSSTLFSQVGINTDNNTPDPSAMLDVKSTNKGFLPPRMTMIQIGGISSPANGLIVFCTDNNKYYGYIASSNNWKEILFGTGTIIPGTCGSLTINHVAGTIAPVTKTVTYNTVINIPGETSKCWITSNLGADHQGIAKDDATEASAGWYWQFNRKQGYKHDGFTRTPNIQWINDIWENFNWLAANDPCRIELGGNWRIPTITEWSNVDNLGGWNNWNAPWNSGLKLHAAGYLLYDDGSLRDRGIFGLYMSTAQSDLGDAWYLDFDSSVCSMSDNLKSHGYSLRCIREN